jgi:hypothetical protein
MDVDPHVLGRLDITVLVLAGALVCIVAWDLLKRDRRGK